MSARFDKQDEEGQLLDEIELFNNLGINQNSTQKEIDIVNVWFQLEQHIQN